MDTQTLSSLIESLARENNDYITVSTTTNIAGSSTEVVSTSLNSYDDAQDDAFEGWWFYMNSTNNPSVNRKVASYVSSTGTISLYGPNLTAETASQTIYLFRIKREQYKYAIIEACKRIYPDLHVKIDDMTLITGNVLPDAHFERWTSTSALSLYTAVSGTLARTSTAGLTRGGTYSAKYTAGADDDYFYISSNTWPALLQLQGKTGVEFHCFALPEVADDASIEIYTVSNDGSTTQTLTSTTSNAAGVFTQLKLESQSINDDLDEIQIRFKVGTDTKYVVFDDAFLCGMSLQQYLLPDEFDAGHVSQVFVQIYGNMDEAFYDPNSFIEYPSEYNAAHILNDGTYEYLLLNHPVNERRIRLIGYKPLETLSADSDTITLDNQRVPLLIAKAQEILFERVSKPVSLEDVSRYEYMRGLAQNKFREQLVRHRMIRPVEKKNV